MGKALKNIPKPDEDKLAMFYGQDRKKKSKKPEGKKSTVDKVTTVVKKTTVDNLTTVVNEEKLKDNLSASLTPNQQSVYLNLFKRSHALGQEVTDWIGYRELAKETRVSLKTVQRAIEVIIKKRLIKKVDFINTAGKKGSKYKVFLPDGI